MIAENNRRSRRVWRIVIGIIIALLVIPILLIIWNITPMPVQERPNNVTLIPLEQFYGHQSFTGYVEEVTFDNGNTRNGYLQLRGETYESGIIPHIRVRFEEGFTMSDVSPSDMEIDSLVIVYHTYKGIAVWIGIPTLN